MLFLSRRICTLCRKHGSQLNCLVRVSTNHDSQLFCIAWVNREYRTQVRDHERITSHCGHGSLQCLHGGMPVDSTHSAIHGCMHVQSTCSWNHAISSHARTGQIKQAIHAYKRMLQESALPDKVTYITLLSACSGTHALVHCKQLHSLILGSELQSDIMLGNALISMYGRCGSLECSRIAFCSVRQPNVVSWNSIIAVHAQHGQGHKALQLFDQMKQEGTMGNNITFVSTLPACSSRATLGVGMQVHACIVASDLVADVVVNTALVSMYGKCDCIENAERLFEVMPERNVISWNTMIAAYAQHGQGRRAFLLFHQMQKESKMPSDVTFLSIISAFSSKEDLPKAKRVHAQVVRLMSDLNISIGNALINMYRRCGSLIYAQRAFSVMPEHDLVSWNAMVATYVQYNQADEVFQLFAHMQLEGAMPNKTTFSSLLSASALKTALVEGMRLHALVIISSFHSDLLVGNALVSMYGKCGSLDKARQVFDKMHERNTISWNAMLDAYSLHGEAKNVLQLYELMRLDQILPDMISFTSILSACSRFGLVDEARNFLVSMNRDYGLVPTQDHFNCVIDLLGRAGKLDEAEDMLDNMPVPHCAVSMRTLLGACRYQSDLERGERTAKHVFVLDPENTAPYTILTNLYGVVDQGSSEDEVMR